MDELQNSQKLPAILIRPEVMRDLKISANEYMVLETVFILSAANGYCYKTLKPMARDLALTKSTCQTIIERLLKRGLLNRSALGLIASTEYVKAAHITETPDPSTKSVRPAIPNRTKSVQTVRNPYNRTKSAPKYYIKNNNSIKSTNVLVDSGKPKPTTGKSYRTMFSELVEALGFTDRVMPTDGRTRKLRVRLKSFSFADILAAAHAIGADGYLQGDNPGGKRYGDIDYLLRSDEMIDKWRQKSENGTKVSWI
jgi:hypothetical protein